MGEIFPTTKFVPWAAFLRDRKGNQQILEQAELVDQLRHQSRQNPDEIELDAAIRNMAEAKSVKISVPDVE